MGFFKSRQEKEGPEIQEEPHYHHPPFGNRKDRKFQQSGDSGLCQKMHEKHGKNIISIIWKIMKPEGCL